MNTAVDEILQTSLGDAEKRGGVCPLCGHSKEVPYSHRKTVLFGLLLASLVIAATAAISIRRHHQTQRNAAASDALNRMAASPQVVELLGKPITLRDGLQGEVKQDETGWTETNLTIPVRGHNGEAMVHVIGGKGAGPWVYTTFEVVFEKEHKKLDLISGRVVEYEPAGYQEVHFEASVPAEYTAANAAPPRWDGDFPCVFASANAVDVVPQLGKCSTPTTHSVPVDRFEADLRYGAFTLRQTDLYLNDVFQVPLTRTYASDDWVAEPQHAFGLDTNHPYDIAPRGTRNPYTFQYIALEDSNFIYFDRISKGTGYADAVFQHTETSTNFYKAITKWNGNGWTTKLADGSEIHFPESYKAKSLAQGAPTEILDAQGNRLELRRDAQRNLQEILTPHGHWIRFQYDDQARITRADDDAGNWATYGYNSEGMLARVAVSSGHERRYSYQKTAMTLIMDEKGGVLLRNWYDNNMLVRQDFANGAIGSYRYHWAPGARYPDTAFVRIAGGSEILVRVADAIPEYVRGLSH